MNRFRVEVTDGPLDLGRIARSGQMFRWVWVPANESAFEGGHWRVHDGDAFFDVADDFEIQTRSTEEEFVKLFRLEQNHAQILKEICRRGPELEPCLRAMTGLRMMRPACRREVLFSFMCSANNHVSRITSMVWKLCEPESENFLSLEAIASLTELELRERGFGYRAKAIPVVARRLISEGGEELLEELSELPYADARRYLIELPGIGPKLADCICLFAFDHQESVPIDTHIWQQLTKIYHPEWRGSPLTHRKYDHAAGEFRERFGDLAGVAHQFLFVQNMIS